MRFPADHLPAAAQRSTSSFGLSLQAFLVACLAVCATMVLLGVYLGSYVTRGEIDNAADRSAVFMEAFLAPVVQGLTGSALSPEIEAELDTIAQRLKARSVPVVQVWWPDGTIAYSTQKSLIGRKVPSSQMTAAASGTVVAHLEGDLTNHGHSQQVQGGMPLLEVYIPLHDLGTRQVFAVGEFYLDASALLAEIRSKKLIIWTALLLATSLILVMLGVVVLRARHVVKAHHHALQERLEEAQKLAAENARLLKAAEQARLEAFRVNEDFLNRIGADLHDGPLQLLSLIMLRLESKAVDLQGPNATSDRARTVDLVSRLARELRGLSSGLTLPELEHLEISGVIRLAVDRHEFHTDTNVTLELEELPRSSSTSLKICIYRVIQEALNNAFWHAGGVGQRVTASHEGNELRVVVSDKGPGMSGQKRKESSLGLAGLTRRVDAFGGRVTIETAQEGGTMVTVILPLPYEAGRSTD
ncbi:sensor histidine kinase [Nitratireductor basaltis]|nr:ATP-binding protein [Nitratireductor basaltis]